MPKYVKESPRITVKFIDSDTENELFEIKDRSWLNVGELFPDSTASNLIIQEMKKRKLPKNVMVMAIAEYKLED